MSQPTRLLYCHCAHAQATPVAAREAALRALCASGLPLETVADLCVASARRAAELQQLAASGPLCIVACASRAVSALFAAANAPLPPETTHFMDLRTASPESLAETVKALPGAPATPPVESFETVWKRLEAPAPEPDGWTGWAPVIDAGRCTHCMQCLSFCLFGVYAAQEGKVAVRAPEQCKPNCPACARVCPEGAILFPKHPAAAIHGGETPGGAARPLPKADLSALLGGDFYNRLRTRNNSPRFSPDRSPEAALEERRNYLAALAREGEIPLEVLEALPPATEMAQRAAQAQAAAQAARERNR